MIEPREFYTNRLTQLEGELSSIKKRLNLSSTLRLLVALLTIGTVYLFWNSSKILVPVLLLEVIFFIILILRHGRLSYERKLKKALISINETEIRVLDRDFHHLPEGNEFLLSGHWYAADIDLFGRGSLFQYLNRTALANGSKKLAEMLQANDIDHISEKQAAVKELSQKPEWRQMYGATAGLLKSEVAPKDAVRWLENYRPFVPKQLKIGVYTLSAISILTSTAYFLNFISGYWVFFVFLVGLSVTGKYLKKINLLSAHTSKLQDTFGQYSKLLALLEEEKFESDLLSKKQKDVIDSEKSSSQTLRKFSKLLDRLDQRNNVLISFVLNGFFLRDLFISNEIEKWITEHKSQVAKWFNTIIFFDAYNSLGNYTFNHQDHIFPEIVDDKNTLIAKGACHPMLDTKKAVRNDIAIKKDEFFIVTGANMAGKSTFLRTVSLQVVMANIGLPVCAESAAYTPIKLITSMRTSDSLADDESYFFSELKRLKFIVEQMGNDRYFIILDEILKGTNSKDKAIGSQKFIKKLVGLGGTGIIATHDLSLCEVAETYPNISNYYFDAHIEDGQLTFDYQFREGVCKNMNASFLLKKMGIVE